MQTSRRARGFAGAAGAAILLLSACGATDADVDGADDAADGGASEYADCVVKQFHEQLVFCAKFRILYLIQMDNHHCAQM